jgi:hypothetical protein
MDGASAPRGNNRARGGVYVRSDDRCISMHPPSWLAAAPLALVIAACAPPMPRAPEVAPQAPEAFPEADYRQLVASGRPVFRVDPGRSLVVIQVFRAGSLARVGHDHVIASHDLHGLVAPDPGRADLYVRLDELVVDEPELRAQAKLDTHPSSEDIAGTRRNMLNQLEADRFPFVSIKIAGNGAKGDEPLSVAISLHGVTRSVDVPMTLATVGDELSARGEMALRQTDFGVKPLSVLGGALQVQDEVKLVFFIRARRVR